MNGGFLPEKAKDKKQGLSLRQVSRVSVGEQVAEQVMRLISEGGLKPGERLPPERDLCKTFGVSRPSLREALRSLSLLGILETRVGDGTWVSKDGSRFRNNQLSWNLFAEQREITSLMEVRVALEGAVAAGAAQHATQMQKDQLATLLDQMAALLDDPERFGKLDLEFHVVLAEAAGNPLLRNLLHAIRAELVLGLARVLPLPDALPLSHQEHLAIFREVRRGEAQLARQKMQAHLEHALSRYNADARRRTKGNTAAA